MKIEKRKHETFLNQISNLKKDLFPNNNLQERFYNFSSIYIDQGDKFIKRLKDNINPLSSNFVVFNNERRIICKMKNFNIRFWFSVYSINSKTST